MGGRTQRAALSKTYQITRRHSYISRPHYPDITCWARERKLTQKDESLSSQTEKKAIERCGKERDRERVERNRKRQRERKRDMRDAPL
jgi:hypothetical protein